MTRATIAGETQTNTPVEFHFRKHTSVTCNAHRPCHWKSSPALLSRHSGAEANCWMSYLYGDAAERSSYDSSYCERAVILQSIGSVWTDELGVIHLSEGGPDEFQSLGNTSTGILCQTLHFTTVFNIDILIMKHYVACSCLYGLTLTFSTGKNCKSSHKQLMNLHVF